MDPSNTDHDGPQGPDRPVDPDATVDVPSPAPLPGSVGAPANVGPYRIVRRLGEGGMGEVYLAEQAEPIRRLVALKVIKQGMDTRAVVGRFEQERQTLALMNHPGIAQVFDAGQTEEGRPFFVMEYVEGVPINDYCDAHRLDTRRRLELFVQVCAAVQHAHQKAIIHRDLKPGNILVSEVDGRPAPKIIDFGIARATEQRDVELTMFTQFGQVVGTPAYMSPEQTDPMNADIDTRTDIYSLGVVLYELLVGATPLDVKAALADGYDAIMKHIRETDVPRPSARARQTTSGKAEIAALRHTDPDRLVRLLRGDLDWILLKTLEKDRNRRYETANGLAMDIGRHLRDEPVLAGPPGAGYRTGKFVRRHRTGVAVSVGAAAVLIAFATVSGIQARVIARARDHANLEADKAKAINQFLTGMLASTDPWHGGEHDMTVVEAIDRSAAAVDSTFADQPLLAAQVHATMGRTYLGLQKLPQAEAEARKGLDLYTAQEGPDALDVADSWNVLTQIARFDMKLDQAEASAREVIRIRGLHLDPTDPLLQEARSELVQVLTEGERYAAADSLLDVMDARLDEADWDTRPARANNLGRRATIASRTDDWAAADSLGRAAVALMQASAPDSPKLPVLMNDMAVKMMQRGDLDEARAAFERVLDLEAKRFGTDHPEYALTLENLGNVAYQQQRYGDCLDILAKVSDIRARHMGEDHPTVTRTKLNMAAVADGMGDHEKALAIYADALPRLEAAYGENSAETAGALCNQSDTLRGAGRLAEAEAGAHKAQGIFESLFGADSAQGTRADYMLGLIRRDQHRPREAAALLEHVIAVAEPTYGRKYYRVQKAARALAEIYEGLGDADKATAYRAYKEGD